MKKQLLAIILVVMGITTLFGIDMGNALSVHGFVSQGYIYSSGNDYLVPDSKNGSSEINEAGITFSTHLSSKLSLGMQFLSRDFGDAGNNTTKLDWAFADYHYKDWLGFRFGKIKTPMGLYNEIRDIDFLRPTVYLSQSIYDEQYRSFLVAFQGGDIYGNVPLGNAGDMDYNAFIGNMNFDQSDIPLKIYKKVANSFLYQLTGDINASVNSVNLRVNDFYGGTVFWNTPISSLRLGGSYYKINAKLTTPRVNLQTPDGTVLPLILEADMKIPHRYLGSLEYIVGPFTLASEYGEQTNQISVVNNNIGKIFDRKDRMFYTNLTYQFMEKMSATASYSSSELVNEKSLLAVGQPITDITDMIPDWQKHRYDYGLTLKYDISFNWSIKAEAHSVDGVFLSSSEILENVPENDLSKNWNYYLAKISFNF